MSNLKKMSDEQFMEWELDSNRKEIEQLQNSLKLNSSKLYNLTSEITNLVNCVDRKKQEQSNLANEIKNQETRISNILDCISIKKRIIKRLQTPSKSSTKSQINNFQSTPVQKTNNMQSSLLPSSDHKLCLTQPKSLKPLSQKAHIINQPNGNFIYCNSQNSSKILLICYFNYKNSVSLLFLSLLL